jgi:tetratricopeptide (TPR) repeat protein
MNEMAIKLNEFEGCISDAVNKLKDFEYDGAYKSIMQAFNYNPNSPKPHNLLGIYYEFKDNYDLARKHYRIAYVLNPLYKPASENLERVSTLFLYKKIPVNYGEEPPKEPDIPKRISEQNN